MKLVGASWQQIKCWISVWTQLLFFTFLKYVSGLLTMSYYLIVNQKDNFDPLLCIIFFNFLWNVVLDWSDVRFQFLSRILKENPFFILLLRPFALFSDSYQIPIRFLLDSYQGSWKKTRFSFDSPAICACFRLKSSASSFSQIPDGAEETWDVCQ